MDNPLVGRAGGLCWLDRYGLTKLVNLDDIWHELGLTTDVNDTSHGHQRYQQ